ncbi:MAG: DUF2288 domain-containing protein [Gammaproteobacteria bacterium]
MNDSTLEREKLNLETSRIAWGELQRFFAAGHAVYVSAELDLVDVAYQFSIDNSERVRNWLAEGKVSKVSDDLARQWLDADEQVWAVVVKPWILVQPETETGRTAHP